MAKNGDNDLARRSERAYMLRFSEALTKAVDREIERRGMKITAWFEELLLKGGLQFSRKQAGIKELLEEEDDSEDQLELSTWESMSHNP